MVDSSVEELEEAVQMEGAPLDSKLKQSETQRNTLEDQTSLIPAHCIKFGGESKNNQKYQLVVSTPSLGLTGLGLGMVESNAVGHVASRNSGLFNLTAPRKKLTDTART